MKPVFVDCETTGLIAGVHQVWEIALVTDTGVEHQWMLDDVKLSNADPDALDIGGWWDRYDVPSAYDRKHPAFAVARDVSQLTAGKVLVGVNPAFDAKFLDVLLRRNNRPVGWHYSVVDCKAMAAGWLHGRHGGKPITDEDGNDAWVDMPMPWRSYDLARWCGVEPPSEQERHTAIGDARFAHRWFTAMTTGEVPA